MKDIAKDILNSLSSSNIEGDLPLVIEEGQVAVPLSKSNFQDLPAGKASEISFIDGGNSEIVGASSFSLQAIRTAKISFVDGKRAAREINDFFLLITFKDNKFSVKTFPDGKLPEITVDSLDKNLRSGNERIVAQRVAGLCRRVAELQVAASSKETVVIDGSLYSKTEFEAVLIKNLKNTFGLSKTSSLMTKNGRVVAAALSTMKDGAWQYSPLFTGGSIEVSFVKLHPKAKYVFRLDSMAASQSILPALVQNSTDPVFLGYPYGLLEADRAARISNKEKEYFKTKLMTELGSDWKEVRAYLRTGDAHGVLDNVR